jgi:hypothetical protein
MANIRQAWPWDAFDAIAIATVDGQFEVEGTDGQEVVLEGEADLDFVDDRAARQTGRWLRIHPFGWRGETRLRLQLPWQKAWVVELAAARGHVQVSRVQARLHVALGKGDVEIRDSQGVFAVRSGKGDVTLERCAEAAMPERPSVPHLEMAGVGIHGEFTWPCGPGAGWDWRGWVQEWLDRAPWPEWLSQAPWPEWFDATCGPWDQFLSTDGPAVGGRPSAVTSCGPWGQFLSTDGQGLSLYLGKGNARVAGVEANSCRVWIGHGDLWLHGRRIGRLQMHLGRGNVECHAIPVSSVWSIDTRHGDIELGLPADAEARLDVATRHGEIRSDFPLVRIGRPGPEARHGRRMVGAIGRSENPSQISLSAMRGDIVIRRMTETSGDTQKKDSEAGVPSEGAAAPTVVAEPAPAGAGDQAPPADDPRLAILESLSRGEITVEEAARLLDGIA